MGQWAVLCHEYIERKHNITTRLTPCEQAIVQAKILADCHVRAKLHQHVWLQEKEDLWDLDYFIWRGRYMMIRNFDFTPGRYDTMWDEAVEAGRRGE